MKNVIFGLAVSAALLAAPLGAFAESAVNDSHAARDALWGVAKSNKGPELIPNVSYLSQDQRPTITEKATMTHTAVPVNAWSDNYAAGRVHAPAGH